MARVLFSASQQSRTEGLESIEIEAKRVAELVTALEARFPELAGLLGGLAVAVDGDIHQDARFVALEADSEVHFIGAIAGGCAQPRDDNQGGATEAAAETAFAAALPPASPAAPPSPLAPLEQALEWLAAGQAVALATVIETWGSSPCPAGSQLVVSGTGEFAGSVSGGCVEGAVVEAAQTVLAGSPPQLLEFDVADDQAWDVGLACGGRVSIRVEPIE